LKKEFVELREGAKIDAERGELIFALAVADRLYETGSAFSRRLVEDVYEEQKKSITLLEFAGQSYPRNITSGRV